VLGDSFLLGSIFLVVKCRFEMFVGLMMEVALNWWIHPGIFVFLLAF
jgi:hypothetical protein